MTLFFARTAVNAACVTGFSLSLLAAAFSPANAGESPANVPQAAAAGNSASLDLAPVPVTIMLASGGHESTYTTEAKTFGDFLSEIGVRASPGDFISPDVATPLVDGMHAEYRAAVALTVVYGKRKYAIRTSALTLDEAIADARIGIGPRDVFSADRRSQPIENEVVRVTRVNEWTERSRRTTAQHVVRRWDAHLALGKTRVISRGVSEIREVTVRFSRRGDAPARKTILRSRILRASKPEIVARGTRPLVAVASVVSSPISKFASTGISSAMHLATSVLHVIATAYTAGCYGCSGTTASGLHAGFGIIAVDPRLIPLGTKLLIPGYGRAIAGDTGGAIVGHRVDLGMNTLADAVRFGRRPITVYVLK